MKNDELTEVQELFSQSKSLFYKRGWPIVRGDEDPNGVFFVKKGYVKLYTLFEQGKELTLNIFKPGSYFSMMWAIGNIPNTYYYQAITEVEIQRINKDILVDFLKKNPIALFALTKRLVIGMDGLLTNVKHMLSGKAMRRVAAALLLLAKRFGRKADNERMIINLPLTHQEIANLAGITRERVSIEMKKLEKKNYISYRRNLLIIKKPDYFEKELFLNRSELAFLDTI